MAKTTMKSYSPDELKDKYIGKKGAPARDQYEYELRMDTLGHIKEPKGVDFTVDPKPLTKADRKRISEIIAYYKATGRKMPMQKPKTKNRLADRRNKRTLV